MDRSRRLGERGQPLHPVGPRPVRYAERKAAAGPARSPEVPRTRMCPQSGGERDEGTARPAPRPPHRRGDGGRPEEARPLRSFIPLRHLQAQRQHGLRVHHEGVRGERHPAHRDVLLGP